MNFKKNFPNFSGGVVKFPPADCQVLGNSGNRGANLPGKSGGKSVGKPTKGKKNEILDVPGFVLRSTPRPSGILNCLILGGFLMGFRSFHLLGFPGAGAYISSLLLSTACQVRMANAIESPQWESCAFIAQECAQPSISLTYTTETHKLLMKLHLPKLLLTAVLAATCIGATAQAAIGWSGDTFYIGENNTTGVNRDGVTGVSVVDGVRIVESINATSKGAVTFWGDLGNGVAVQALIGTISTKSNITLGVTKPTWGPRYFDELTIEQVNVANKGVINLNIAYDNADDRSQINKVVINSVDGSVGNITVKTSNELTIGGTDTIHTINGTLTNAGVLTLKGTVNLGKTLSNNGILNLDSVVKLDDFAASIADSKLTNGTHGFRSGLYSYDIASGGTINTTEGFTATLDGADITENLIISGSSITYTAQRTGTIYEITSAHTSKVVYNGSVGEMASASGFYMENGTALELAASTATLKKGITIAAGGEGSVTLDFTGGTHDFDALVDTQSGICNLNISGEGTVVSTNHDGQNGFVTGNISITDGGKLVLQNKDALGWGTVPPNINIDNATLELGGRQTLKTNINMTGGATITAWDNSSALTEGNGPMLHSYGAKLTASGTGNVIDSSVGIAIEHALTIEVTGASDELTIGGAFSTRNNSTNAITKSGAGKLILNGVDKSIAHQMVLSAGTLQLGGTTEADGLVTLASGINQSADTTLDVVGKAKIQGTSTLGGAITVASTGELTLNSTYTLDGSLTVAEGGKVIGGSDLVGKNDAPTAPLEGTNGWGTTTLTILKSAEDATVSGLNSVWYNDKEYTISTSVADGITSYQFNAQGTSYYVQNADEAVEYSTASGLTQAETIYMSNGTTLVVKEDLNHNTDITVVDGAKVNYEVVDATLTIDHEGDVTNISSILVDGGTATVSNWSTNLGSSSSLVDITLTNGGAFTFKAAGGSRGHMYANINVDGSGKVAGASYGNSGNIHGSVSGKGTLTVGAAYGTNYWTISGTISDGSDGKLAIEKIDNVEVIFTGANTYSGGTTVNAGKLTAANESALGTGKVTMNGGTLAQSAALSVSSMEYNGGTVDQGNHALTVTGKLDVKNNMTIGHAANEEAGTAASTGAISIGSLDLAADTTLTTYGNLEVAEGGTIKFGNGSTMSVNGSLTLDASAVQLGFDITSATDVVLATATGGMNVANVGSWTGAQEYTFGDKTYTSGLSVTNDTLSLTFKEMVTSGEPITTTVTGDPLFANGMLTLDVTTEEGIILSSGDMVLVNILESDFMDKILTAVGDAEFFGVTLRQGETEIVGGDNYNVGFLSENGCYYGELVGGTWQYSVEQIPEPTTATLSLLALMGLAARRRRK